MQVTVRILSREDIRAALSMSEAIELMRSAYTQLSSGEAVVPQRQSLELPEAHGRLLLMPVHLPGEELLGLKVVSLFQDNPARGLPYIHSLFLLIDGRDGRPLALMDAEYLTALRTGAASGLATRILSREDSSTLVVFGAGAQAHLQLDAVCTVRPIAKVFVVDPNRDRLENFCAEAARRVPCPVVPASSSEVVREADIVCTATTSKEPVFADALLNPGTHINAIGAYRPDMCELPPATVLRGRLFVDHRASCLSEAGEIVQLVRSGKMRPEWIRGEIGELLLGRVGGRERRDEVTVFKSVGNAVQDIAAARRVFVAAGESGLGSEVRL